MKKLLSILSSMLLFLNIGHSQIVDPNRVYTWTPGTTIGVVEQPAPRTHLIDVTQSPYNADNTGNSDCVSAILAAVSDAQTNDVIYFPDGRYKCTGYMGFLTKSGITYRGDKNSVIMGLAPDGWQVFFRIGPDRQNQAQTTYSIVSGASKGSTSVTLSAPPTTFVVGDQVSVSDSDFGSHDGSFPRISVFYYDHQLVQQMKVASISGNTVTFTQPIMCDFTNTPILFDCAIHGTRMVGIENLTFTCSNSVTGDLGSYSQVVEFSMCDNCWMTNCTVTWAHNYSIGASECVNLNISHNTISHCQGGGSNHGGLLISDFANSLVEDNIFSDGLQPGIEFNTGVCADAFFANLFTNNVIDVDNHGPHPMMNLWEANDIAYTFEMDGYFGSASHQTLLRNAIRSTWVPLQFKKWNSYHQIIGNVLGTTNSGYLAFSHDINNTGYQILENGRPNIGNVTYVGTNPPISWNYPGDMIDDVTPNGIFTFTNDQVNVTTLVGDFSNIPVFNGNNGALIFQDPADTNLYYPRDGIPVTPVNGQGGTSTNININRSFTVHTGWKVYWSQQNPPCYQQLQTPQRSTFIVSGNYDYYNNGVTWDSNGVQTIPNSLIYDSAPSWWGSTRWPAIDPLSANKIDAIPASKRYNSSIIPSDRVVSWQPGVTVGSRQQMPNRTHKLNVVTDYGADNTGATDAHDAIQSAINAAVSGDIVYFPTGKYRLMSGLTADKSNITFMGDGPTQSTLVGLASSDGFVMLTVGHQTAQVDQGDVWYLGSVLKGSTNFDVPSLTGSKGWQNISVGQTYWLWHYTSPDRLADNNDTNCPVISVMGFNHMVKQTVMVTAISGTNISITPPIVWNFTNSPVLVAMQAITLAPVSGVVLQDFGMTLTNNGESGFAAAELNVSQASDCWFTNLFIDYPTSKGFVISDSLHLNVDRVTIQHGASGPGHAGIIMNEDSGILVQNNILADGLQPAIEINDGVMGCAFFANLITNDVMDIDCHNTHPAMNLFEANYMNGFEMDGLFGSASHFTLIRNRIYGTVALKRFVSNVSVVGNVLGSTNYDYVYLPPDTPTFPNYGIFELGRPNIGNVDFIGISPPLAWNCPGGGLYGGGTNTGPVIVGDQVNTNTIYGNFTNIIYYAAAPAAYTLGFQETDTNRYYNAPQTVVPAVIVPTGDATLTNLTLNIPVTVSNGWKVYMTGQAAYQQLQTMYRHTQLITGNAVCTNYIWTAVWDTNGVQTIPTSLLYPNSAPSWWGTNRWPAIDPLAQQTDTPTPASLRYLGIDSGASPAGGSSHHKKSSLLRGIRSDSL